MTEAARQAQPERIHVRRTRFEFGTDIPDDWGTGNPMIAALMAGLSAAFPPGERFFIDSVRHYADRIDDPELQERIRGFVAQEGNHSREHVAFNRFLDQRGLPIGAMQRFVERRLRRLRKTSPPEANLARTVALEHLTAFLASAILEDPDFLEQFHPAIAKFWAWHAIEEIEHRSVAFDVYKACVDDEALRVRTMRYVTVLFTTITVIRTAIVMKEAGTLGDVGAWARGIDLTFGARGVVRKALPLYRAYYRRDFHPDEHDSRATLERARRKYLGETAA